MKRLHTIIENCKRQELNPEAYLKEVLTHLPVHPTREEALALTPWSIAQAQKKLTKKPPVNKGNYVTLTRLPTKPT